MTGRCSLLDLGRELSFDLSFNYIAYFKCSKPLINKPSSRVFAVRIIFAQETQGKEPRIGARVVSSIFCLEAALFVAQERRANQRHTTSWAMDTTTTTTTTTTRRTPNAKALRAHLLRHLP